MKRFLLFHGENCYPKGGAKDFKGSFETEKDAVDAYPVEQYIMKWGGNSIDNGWANIFDLKREKIILKYKDNLWHHGDNEYDCNGDPF